MKTFVLLVAALVLANIYRYGLEGTLAGAWMLGRLLMIPAGAVIGVVALYLLVRAFFYRMFALNHYRAEEAKWNR